MISNLKYRTLHGLLWSFIDLVLNQGVTLLIQILLARILLPEDFGIVGIVIAFVAVAQTFVDSGFTNALIRETTTTEIEYSTVFYYNLMLSIILYLLIYLSSTTIASFYNDIRLTSILRILSLTIIINSLGIIHKTKMVKSLDFKSQAIANSISAIIAGIISIYYASNGLGIWSLVVYNILRSIMQMLILMSFIKWKPVLSFSIESFKKYFNFGWKLLIASLIDNVYANLNSLIIGKIYSKADLGYYTNANKLSSIASTTIYGIVGKVSFPVFGQLNTNNLDLKNGVRKVIKFTMFFNFPIMIGLIAVAEPLILVLIGEKWSVSILYFQLLCISGSLFPLQAINLNILQIRGRTDLFLKVTIIKRISSFLTILLLLILRYSLTILLIINVIDAFISYFVNSYYSSKLLNYSMNNQITDISKSLVSSVIMGIVVILFQRITNYSDILTLVISTLIGIITYVALSYSLKNKSFYETIDIILKALKVNNV